MISATRYRASSSAPAGLADMALMQKAKHQIKEAAQELELVMKAELDLIIKEQISLRDDAKRAFVGFADGLIALENKIDYLERSRATSRSELEIAEGFAKDFGALRHDVYLLMEARNEIGTEVHLRFTRLPDWLGRVEAHMATVTGNAQLPNSRFRPQKA